MNALTKHEAAALPVRLSSPYARTAIVSPYDFEMVVEYEFYEGEEMILWPTELAHPGSPPSVQLLTCRVGSTDITEMLSLAQTERIEDEILSQLEG